MQTRLGFFWVSVFVSLCLGSLTVASAADDLVHKDLSYKTVATTDYERERCKVDLYLPRDAKDFPTLVWFHGGALQGGDKAGDFAPAFARRFADEGIAVASANYRLSPKVNFPAYLEDAAAAVAFVREEIKKAGGSPDKIFVSGHSAGGYLTAMLGVDEQYLGKQGLKITDIAGFIPISGQMITHSTIRKERGISETQPLIDAAAPAFHVRKDTAPFLVIAGSKDLPARAEESRYFVAAMKAVKNENVTYLEVAGRDHGTVANKLAEKDDEVAAAILAFIRKHAE